MTNEVYQITNIANGLLHQMQEWPVAILIVAALIVFGWAFKIVSLFPNKFIPVALLLLGAVGNGVLGEPGSVHPAQRYPEAVLALQGFLLGFGSWALHFFLLKRFEKFLPFLSGKTGDTTIINKKDTE